MSVPKFYPTVSEYYDDLLHDLRAARRRIHMAFYAFDAGKWSHEVALILKRKAANGLQVHLMVDHFGMYFEKLVNWRRNRELLANLAAAGVVLTRFNPRGIRLGIKNRLHCKFVSIDDTVAYVGGSNIGDHYCGWIDHNFRFGDGFADSFVMLYEYLRGVNDGSVPPGALPELSSGRWPIFVTVPGHRFDVRRQLLDLILRTSEVLYIRTWYFLPDQELLLALLSQAEKGVEVNIMISDKTRVGIIDLINRLYAPLLRKSGVSLFRYRGAFMHAKMVWNEQGDFMVGSANIDPWAMKSNFECMIQVGCTDLTERLTELFWSDCGSCHAPELVAERPFANIA